MNFITLTLIILSIILIIWFAFIGMDFIFAQTPNAFTVNPQPNTPPVQFVQTPPQIQYQPIEVKPAGQNDYLAMVMPLIVGAGGVILTKFAKDTHDKVNKVETITRENAAAIVDSKAVEKELARLMFVWNKEKAEALDNSPETKLQNLEDKKQKALDTASKA